jgi:hypothetical protein
MRLPFAENAFVDVRKLTEYSLNKQHERGKHKARVFGTVLGITIVNHEILSEAIRQAVLTQNATLTDVTQYGTRYVVDFKMNSLTEEVVTVRSTWILAPNSEIPRLTNCFIP